LRRPCTTIRRAIKVHKQGGIAALFIDGDSQLNTRSFKKAGMIGLLLLLGIPTVDAKEAVATQITEQEIYMIGMEAYVYL
jgi:hypothetical protein